MSTGVFCLVCSASCLSSRNSVQIFSKEVSTGSIYCLFKFIYHILHSQGTTGRIEHFASLLSKILNKEIKEDPEQTQVLCKKCYKLVDELDELQNRVIEIKNEIIDSHKCSVEKTEVEDEQETKEIIESKSLESNKENEVPKKILDIPSSDEDSGQVIYFKKFSKTL